jgi:hypothetical protein
MIRLSFEIVEQPPSVVIHGKREYNHKTPTEEFYAALVAPIMSKALKRLATVQEALGRNTRGLYVQGGPEGSNPILYGETGIGLLSRDGPCIMCLKCGRVSHLEADVKNKYCGFCHLFHESL